MNPLARVRAWVLAERALWREAGIEYREAERARAEFAASQRVWNAEDAKARP